MQFASKQMGDDLISNRALQKLERNLDDLQSLVNKMLTFIGDSLNAYMNSMQKSIDQTKTYFNEMDLMELHQTTKNGSIAEVCI